MKKYLLTGAFVAGILAQASTGWADLPDKGNVALGADRVYGFTHSTMDVDFEDVDLEIKATSNNFALFGQGDVASPYAQPRLALDFFVIDGLSIGGSLTYYTRSGETETDSPLGQTEEDQPDASGFVISPRIGYAVMFGDNFGIWPRGGFTYFTAESEVDGNDAQMSGLAFTAEFQLVIAPGEHFALTLGPAVDLGLTGGGEADLGAPLQEEDFDGKITDLSVYGGLVGWF